MAERADIKPNIEEDRKPNISNIGDIDDPIANAHKEKVKFIRRERQMVEENYHLRRSKMDYEERMIEVEEENRRLRLVANSVSGGNDIVKPEPQDIKPNIAISDGPGSNVTEDTAIKTYGPENIITISSDDEEEVAFAGMAYTSTQAKRSPVPTVRASSQTYRDDIGVDESIEKAPNRKKPPSNTAQGKSSIGNGRARPPVGGDTRIIAQKWGRSRRPPPRANTTEGDSDSGSSDSSPDTDDEYRGSASPAGTSKSQRPIRSSQAQRDRKESGSDSDDEPLKRRPKATKSRDKRKRRNDNKVSPSKNAKSDTDDESDSEHDLTTDCGHYKGSLLRKISVEAIGNRLDRTIRKHGITKMTVQKLEAWWPKIKVAKVHNLDTRASYLFLHAVHVWWSRLSETVLEEGYRWPEGMGDTPAWLRSRIKEIHLSKAAASVRAERDMKTEGASISTDSVICLNG